MIETLLVLGCIIFFILLAISFQERSIMYKDYPTSCDVTYIPKKENIYMLGPSNFNSSPYNFKTKDFRKLELENLSISELKAEIFKEEYTEETIEDIYSTRYGDFSDMRKDQLIDIILDIESDSFKKDISRDNYESDTFLDKILL